MRIKSLALALVVVAATASAARAQSAENQPHQVKVTIEIADDLGAPDAAAVWRRAPGKGAPVTVALRSDQVSAELLAMTVVTLRSHFASQGRQVGVRTESRISESLRLPRIAAADSAWVMDAISQLRSASNGRQRVHVELEMPATRLHPSEH